MPNKIGQAYGLTVLSPIKPDDAGESHAEAVRAYVQKIEASGESPFAKITHDGAPTVHTARWVLLDQVADEGGHFHADSLKSKYLLLDMNLDTDDRDLDGFLDDMAAAMPKEIEELYGHCVGFDKLDGFRDYIKRCQIETTFFFVDYGAEDRGKVKNVQKALAAQRRFVDLAAAAQTQTPAEARAALSAFIDDLDWTCPPGQIVKHTASAPQRSLSKQRVDVTDVQGNVLRAYKHPFARHLYFRVVDGPAARTGLAALLPEVDHSGDWGKEKPKSTLNVAFSYSGLAALGVPDKTLVGFPIAFRMGMLARAAVLGDTGQSAPESWEEGIWKDGVHVLVSVYSDDEAHLDLEAKWAVEVFGKGVTLVGSQDAALLNIDGQITRKEHFGFTDGLGTADIDGANLPSTPGSGKLDGQGQWTGLAPGELLYGYRDEASEFPDTPNPPSFVQNGTFLVYRKLRENVAVFRDYLSHHGARYPGGEELLAAKMVGRFRDGTPLAVSPFEPDPKLVADPNRNNDFRYGDDPEGAKCPVGAHIRRTRPRDALGFDGKLADRRRLQRRGMPYGKPLPQGSPDDGADRGIVFMAYNIDIERQFEFIQQQWLNYGNSFRQGNDKDIMTGDHDDTGKAVIQATKPGEAPYLCTELPRFVDMRGGEYFFVPGIAGLWAIVSGK